MGLQPATSTTENASNGTSPHNPVSQEARGEATLANDVSANTDPKPQSKKQNDDDFSAINALEQSAPTSWWWSELSAQLRTDFDALLPHFLPATEDFLMLKREISEPIFSTDQYRYRDIRDSVRPLELDKDLILTALHYLRYDGGAVISDFADRLVLAEADCRESFEEVTNQLAHSIAQETAVLVKLEAFIARLKNRKYSHAFGELTLMLDQLPPLTSEASSALRKIDASEKTPWWKSLFQHGHRAQWWTLVESQLADTVTRQNRRIANLKEDFGFQSTTMTQAMIAKYVPPQANNYLSEHTHDISDFCIAVHQLVAVSSLLRRGDKLEEWIAQVRTAELICSDTNSIGLASRTEIESKMQSLLTLRHEIRASESRQNAARLSRAVRSPSDAAAFVDENRLENERITALHQAERGSLRALEDSVLSAYRSCFVAAQLRLAETRTKYISLSQAVAQRVEVALESFETAVQQYTVPSTGAPSTGAPSTGAPSTGAPSTGALQRYLDRAISETPHVLTKFFCDDRCIDIDLMRSFLRNGGGALTLQIVPASGDRQFSPFINGTVASIADVIHAAKAVSFVPPLVAAGFNVVRGTTDEVARSRDYVFCNRRQRYVEHGYYTYTVGPSSRFENKNVLTWIPWGEEGDSHLITALAQVVAKTSATIGEVTCLDDEGYRRKTGAPLALKARMTVERADSSSGATNRDAGG